MLISKGLYPMIWLRGVKNLMKFGPVSPEFKRVVTIQPFVDQQFGYIRLAAGQTGGTFV